MPKKNTVLHEQQAKLIELLNRRLADAIDLQLQSRQAYWNVKGPHFMALRELFDKVARGVEEYANLIAEHIVQLGGMAEGTAHAVARRTSLDESGLLLLVQAIIFLGHGSAPFTQVVFCAIMDRLLVIGTLKRSHIICSLIGRYIESVLIAVSTLLT